MHIDRDRFLRAALLLSLGGTPVASGCLVVSDDEAQAPPPQQQPVQQTSGGEAPGYRSAPPAEPVQVVGPANEGGYAPTYEAGYAPSYEGGPANEGYAPANEGGPVYE